MTDLKLPQPEDYRSDMQRAIRETRHLIQEALGYIREQMDGPVTMTYTLKDIDKAVDDIQFEASYLSGEAERNYALLAKVLAQRDEALRQRDILIRYLNSLKKRRRQS